jgi:hypothetical protein
MSTRAHLGVRGWRSMGRFGLAAGAILLTVVALGLPRAGATEPGTVADARHTTPLTAEDLPKFTETYRQHLTLLANPFFEGRAPGTKGNRIAADYIEFQYRQLGLLPAFPGEAKDENGQIVTKDRASYRQEFVAPRSSRPGDSTRLREQVAAFSAGGNEVTLAAGKDFNALGYSGNGEVTGEVVFAGYSVVNDDKDYTSYPEGADLTGKIVMVMRFEPMDDEGKSKWADMRWSFAAGLEAKFREAMERKASAVILVSAPGAKDDRVNKLEDISLAGPRTLDVPVVMLSLEAADRLVKAGDEQGRSLLDLRKLADEAGGLVPLPKATVTVKVDIEQVPLLTDNVGAVLPGKGALAEEFVVIGSHYDHVGYGYLGARAEHRGKIHPGADDNASGSSGNLLTAQRLTEAYASLPEDANARSILFLAFSAEESGLNGSAFYVKNPIVGIEKHAFMLNMDMIGRLRDDKLEVGGVASAVGLKEWTQPYWDESGLKIAAKDRGPSNSDHASFYRVKIPVLFFFTGLHTEYHTPADVIETVNFEGGVRVADLAYRIALDSALRPEPFVFSEGARSEERRDNNDQAANTGPVGGVSVRFGIAPGDYSGDTGVLIGDVRPGLPAEKAGLKAGDLMIKWGDTELKDVEGWMPLLAKAKPGDKVVITFIRDKQVNTTEVTLVAPASRRSE